eukprot:6207220-Pleurochrysis_carterae.AAC.2
MNKHKRLDEQTQASDGTSARVLRPQVRLHTRKNRRTSARAFAYAHDGAHDGALTCTRTSVRARVCAHRTAARTRTPAPARTRSRALPPAYARSHTLARTSLHTHARVTLRARTQERSDDRPHARARLCPLGSLLARQAEDWGADALAEALECVAAWEEARGGVWRSSEASPPDECNRLVPYADASTRTMGGRATRAGVEDAIGGPSALLDGTGASRDQASVQSSRERSRENSDGEIGRKGCVGGGPDVGSGGCSS